jgi:hypothetical protein
MDVRNLRNPKPKRLTTGRHRIGVERRLSTEQALERDRVDLGLDSALADHLIIGGLLGVVLLRTASCL